MAQTHSCSCSHAGCNQTDDVSCRKLALKVAPILILVRTWCFFYLLIFSLNSSSQSSLYEQLPIVSFLLDPFIKLKSQGRLERVIHRKIQSHIFFLIMVVSWENLYSLNIGALDFPRHENIPGVFLAVNQKWHLPAGVAPSAVEELHTLGAKQLLLEPRFFKIHQML